MKEIIEYAKGLSAKDNVIELIEKIYNNQSRSEFEHIIDFLIHKDFADLSWAGYELLLEKTNKWNKMLQQNVAIIDEEYGNDIEIVKDFGDGFKFVKLISKNSYTREGNLMRHCVSSYFGRDVEIYSLRDAFNKPHCTIEKDMQIKGKGNGSITPKYVRYVVEFLESLGMEMRDKEMGNLGYIVEPFVECIKDTGVLFRGEYVHESHKVEYVDDVLVFEDLSEAIKYVGNKKVLFKGCANFENSEIDGLGNLERISGNASFRNSEVTSLGNLKSIGGSAFFRNSKITNLGNLSSIGEYADFENSKVTSLGKLVSIGGNAYFGNSKVTSLGNLESIGGSAYFGNSKVTSLGNLESIGEYAYFGNSKVTSLGNLESIGGNAYFGDDMVNEEDKRRFAKSKERGGWV